MIAVVGAGPAGVACALTLRAAGAEVVLVAPPPAEGPAVGESLPAAAGRLLRDLGLEGVLDQVPQVRCAGHASAWSGPTVVTRDALQDPEGPGWRVDRAAFNAALLGAAVQAGVPWIQDRVVSVQGGLGLASQVLDVTAVVDASGRRAAVARRLGVSRTVLDRTLARVAWGPGDLADQRTLVESVPEGWWYSAALPGGQVVAALHTQDAESVRSEATWFQAMARAPHTLARVGPIDWTHHRTADAGISRLDAPGGPGWIAVGDAVQAFDPLGSQGMLHALYSGRKGARALLRGDLRAYAADLQQLWIAQMRQRQELLAAKRPPAASQRHPAP